MTSRASGSASEVAALQGVERAFADEGTAVDAVIAGFLAASAARPGVIFSPLQAVVAGPGIGARAFDGRSRQPGMGTARPRGFQQGQPIPKAALAAVPGSLAALALLHAHHGTLSLARLAKPAVDAARSSSAARAAVLDRIGALGAAALHDPFFVRPLLRGAGRIEGGILTEDDLRALRPDSAPPLQVGTAGRVLLMSPWAAESSPRAVHTIVAGDARGVMAVLCYCPDDDGLPVPDLGVCLPREAVPVIRGVTRTSPGASLPSSAPIAIALEKSAPIVALALVSAVRAAWGEIASSWETLGCTASDLLRDALVASGAHRVIGVVGGGGTNPMRPLSASHAEGREEHDVIRGGE